LKSFDPVGASGVISNDEKQFVNLILSKTKLKPGLKKQTCLNKKFKI
jgi:hypothetical protein